MWSLLASNSEQGLPCSGQAGKQVWELSGPQLFLVKFREDLGIFSTDGLGSLTISLPHAAVSQAVKPGDQ